MVAYVDTAIAAGRTAPGLHPDVEAMPRERLEALQLQRLQASLCNAWEQVPWQRARLRAAGLSDPQELRSLADLQRLPFMVKSDLRDHYPFGLFARPVAGWRGCMRRRERPASPRWSATRAPTSTPGPS